MNIRIFDSITTLECMKKRLRAYSRGHYDLRAEDREDIIQATLIEFWRERERFHGQCSLFTWICYLFRWRVGAFIHRWSGKETFSFEDKPSSLESENATYADVLSDGEDMPADYERRELRAEILAAMLRLPLISRDVLHFVVMEQMSHEDYAHLRHIPNGTVRSRLSRARRRMRGLLSQDGRTERNGRETLPSHAPNSCPLASGSDVLLSVEE